MHNIYYTMQTWNQKGDSASEGEEHRKGRVEQGFWDETQKSQQAPAITSVTCTVLLYAGAGGKVQRQQFLAASRP